MNIVVNGREILFEKKNISHLLEIYKIDPETVAVERNGTILHREEFSETEIKEGDTIEIVRFVGGG